MNEPSVNHVEAVLRRPTSVRQGPRRIVSSIANLDAEIPMSGLLGYYSNSSGNDANYVVEALVGINCPHAAEIIAKANQLFRGGSPSEVWDTRLRQLADISEDDEQKIADLSSAYLRYPDGLGEKFEHYVKTHVTILMKREQ